VGFIGTGLIKQNKSWQTVERFLLAAGHLGCIKSAEFISRLPGFQLLIPDAWPTTHNGKHECVYIVMSPELVT
jgi:hypothetical protein